MSEAARDDTGSATRPSRALSNDARQRVRDRREELEALAESDLPAAPVAKAILELAR